MIYDQDESIPRIAIQRDRDPTKIVCLLDQLTKQRYGAVLANGKQGRHLFSISYCLASLAANYSGSNPDGILIDIVNRFHLNFLTMIVINARFVGIRTCFFDDWESNIESLMSEYSSMKLYQQASCDKEKAQLDICIDSTLESYLNAVGALMHILPCNVAFSENASDPFGGANCMKARRALYELHDQYSLDLLYNTIKLQFDQELIKEIFVKNAIGANFNPGNMPILAFMIIQIMELRSLFNSRLKLSCLRFDHAMTRDDIVNTVFKTAFEPLFEGQKASESFITGYTVACSDAIYQIVDIAKTIHMSFPRQIIYLIENDLRKQRA